MDEEAAPVQPSAGKRPRTEAQKAAFANMIAARDKQVYEKMKQVEAPPVAADPVEPEPHVKQAEAVPQQVLSVEQPKAFEGVSAPAAAAAMEHFGGGAPAEDCGEDDVEFVDVDELVQQLNSTREELSSLKEQVGSLVTQHGDLSHSFRQHHVKLKDEIYFI